MKKIKAHPYLQTADVLFDHPFSVGVLNFVRLLNVADVPKLVKKIGLTIIAVIDITMPRREYTS